jgi:signal transduction histidine kinase
MFKRPADLIAALSALTAIGLVLLSVALQRAFWPYEGVMLPLAVAMLLVGVWWLGRRASGSPFRELAVPASVATIMPLLGVATPAQPIALGVWLLAAVAAGTLGVRLADWLAGELRPLMVMAAIGLATLAATLGVIRPDSPGWTLLSILLLAGATASPAVVAGVSLYSSAARAGGRTTIVPALELAVAGVTPAIAVVTVASYGASPIGAVPLIAWIVFVLAAQYFAVGPLARTASVATTQRDIVVAAMEAERTRIAADIHDDALQELTLLGWRLDAAGAKDGATNAREVADRLRAIVGDLRLPILDDLGAGPALEWLVERVERLAGGEVRLERGDQVRPPPDVELAFFRIAQEALSNAVRHGRPPIVVRYWTSPSGASLSVADSGGGFDPTRVELGADGHFGLLNMRQRAEQIGALLDVRRWPSGGTQVALEWRAP